MQVFIYLILFAIGWIAGLLVNTTVLYFSEEERKRKVFFSYIGRFYKGGCHWLIELFHGALWVFIVYWCATQEISFMTSLIYCLLFSALAAISLIDFRTYEIPLPLNALIGLLGIFHLLINRQNWSSYVIGFFSVSLFLYLLYQLTNGAAIGGGDVKLMACTGLILGWRLNILAFFLGCIFASVIHLIRMKITKEGHMLAMGPYLALGILTALLFGNEMIHWYIAQCLV